MFPLNSINHVGRKKLICVFKLESTTLGCRQHDHLSDETPSKPGEFHLTMITVCNRYKKESCTLTKCNHKLEQCLMTRS